MKMEEWEKTVMSEIERANIFYRGKGTLEAVCEKQAEISYKAGIKEVVDWVINHYDDGLYLDEFKKQVKKWGVE